MHTFMVHLSRSALCVGCLTGRKRSVTWPALQLRLHRLMLPLRLILVGALTLTRAAVVVVATIAQAMTTRQTFKPASLLLLRPFLPTMRLALMQL